MSEKRRPLFWEGSSKKDFKGFPVPVQKDMGVALFIAQLGQSAASAMPWKGLGSGVYELVEDHRGTRSGLSTRCKWLMRFTCCMRFRRNQSPASRRRSRTLIWSRSD